MKTHTEKADSKRVPGMKFFPKWTVALEGKCYSFIKEISIYLSI